MRRTDTATRRLVEMTHGAPLPQVLERLYGSGLSQVDVAATLQVSRGTVVGWMREYGIETRDPRRLKQRRKVA